MKSERKSTIQVTLGHIPVKIIRKQVKHIRLRIVPPHHEVRISVPEQMPIETAQALAMTKFDWLANRLAVLREQDEASARARLAGEYCYVWGHRYALQFAEHAAAPSITFEDSILRIFLRPNTSPEKRQAILEQWYRDELEREIPMLIKKWEPRMGVSVARLRLQHMKTRWGTCNTATRTIRINTELAKKPPEHLEYVVVHEMTHLIHSNHGPGFMATMDQHIPKWREHRRALDIFPRD